MLVLILSNGMPGSDLTAVIEGLKNSSKSIGTHKRRELYWQAYTKMSTKASSLASEPCFLVFRAPANDVGDGDVEIVELTKRQRGLLGSCDVMGHKLKAPENPTSKSWCIAWSEEEAQIVWDDLMGAEPCIYITSDGVYVGTRYKRVLCKGLSGPLKAVNDVNKLVAELAPDKPLRSISFVGNDPPAINGYNIFLAGSSSLGPTLPATIGHVASNSTSEIYDYFLERRNMHYCNEAGKLIAQMLADTGKGLMPIVYSSSTKEASIAYKNALMKRVFVHESSKKFIDRARADGQVELVVISGDVENTEFGKYGKLVFELFYRVDLTTFK